MGPRHSENLGERAGERDRRAQHGQQADQHQAAAGTPGSAQEIEEGVLMRKAAPATGSSAPEGRDLGRLVAAALLRLDPRGPRRGERQQAREAAVVGARAGAAGSIRRGAGQQEVVLARPVAGVAVGVGRQRGRRRGGALSQAPCPWASTWRCRTMSRRCRSSRCRRREPGSASESCRRRTGRPWPTGWSSPAGWCRPRRAASGRMQPAVGPGRRGCRRNRRPVRSCRSASAAGRSRRCRRRPATVRRSLPSRCPPCRPQPRPARRRMPRSAAPLRSRSRGRAFWLLFRLQGQSLGSGLWVGRRHLGRNLHLLR